MTDRLCVPCVASTVPSAGEYVNVPGTVAVASSCVADSDDPTVIAAGVGHVITGVAWFTTRETVAVADL